MDARGIGLGVLDIVVKVLLVIIGIMLISKYASEAYTYGYNIYNQVPASRYDTRTVSVSITDSMSVGDIAELLENRGLIKDSKLFWLQERFSEYHGMIAPGTYELSSTMTAEEMFAVMAGQGEKKEEEE